MAIEPAYEDARTWHYERYESVLQSRRRAWYVAGAAGVALLLSLTALVLVEKVAPFGAYTAPATGAVLIGLDVWRLAL